MKDVSETRVSEEIVRAEPRPAFTKSWHPFSHAEVLNSIGKACDNLKLKIVNREYSIRINSKMFGVWEIAGKDKEFNFGIGIRNSIDKTHSVGLCACEKIFVCSNFVFQSYYEYVLFRKHTGSLELNEITFLAQEALKALIPKFEQLRQWHGAMKELKLTAEQSSLLIVAAMKRDLVPPAKFQLFHELYMGSDRKYSAYDNSLYAFHGAATELMNPNNLLTQTWKQDRLNYFIDYEVPILMKHGKRKDIVLDLKAVEKEGFKKYQVDKVERKEEVKKIAAVIKESFKESKKKKKVEKKVKTKVEVKPKTEKKLKKKSKSTEEKTKEIVAELKKEGIKVIEAKKKVKAAPKFLVELPEYHDDFQKSIEYIAAKKSETGKIKKVVIVKHEKGFSTDFYGSKKILRTFGFHFGDRSKHSQALHALLKVNLKLGTFTSIYMSKATLDHGLIFTQDRVKHYS